MVYFLGNNVPYNLRGSYELLLSSLEDAAEQSDCGTVRGIGKFTRLAQDTYDLDAYLYLSDWREKAWQRFQILIRTQERIRGPAPNYVLEQSTVRVAYFYLEEDGAHLLHSIHFDHGRGQDCHPIFHAQITNETVSLGKYASELEFEFKQIPCSPVHQNARIPTSDMTLPSALVCIAADHIKPDPFGRFLNSVIEIQRRMPQPSFEKTKVSIQSEPHHLRSSHWFAHMKPGV